MTSGEIGEEVVVSYLNTPRCWIERSLDHPQSTILIAAFWILLVVGIAYLEPTLNRPPELGFGGALLLAAIVAVCIIVLRVPNLRISDKGITQSKARGGERTTGWAEVAAVVLGDFGVAMFFVDEKQLLAPSMWFPYRSLKSKKDFDALSRLLKQNHVTVIDRRKVV